MSSELRRRNIDPDPSPSTFSPFEDPAEVLRRTPGLTKESHSSDGLAFAAESLSFDEPQVVTSSNARKSSDAGNADSGLGMSISAAVLFLLLAWRCGVVANVLPIADCDETYNYWEPTHYLLYGSGFQTWEYSPEFALRSYFYILPHAAIGKLAQMIFGENEKLLVFYSIRCALGALCALSEFALFRALASRFGSSASFTYLVATAFAPGMFHASVSYLPSSMSMCLLSFAFASWIKEKYQWATFWVVGSVVLGWPFVVLVAAPLALHAIFASGFFRTLFTAVISLALWLGSCVAVDSHYYQRLLISPLELLKYNVASSDAERGSHLYGVEEWTFYPINLALNFSVIAVLAASSIVLVPLFSSSTFRRPVPRLARVGFILPLLMWVGFMSLQAHKEERFMYPIYPWICVCAALTVCGVWRMRRFRALRELGKAVIVVLVLVYVAVSVSRSAALVYYYGAPMDTYVQVQGMQRLDDANGDGVVRFCTGKEWYRFPSSFFLPGESEMRFVQSAFDGLLPRPFLTEGGTYTIQPGFNDLNRAEPDQHVLDSTCDYIIEQEIPGQQEPRYSSFAEEYDVLSMEQFLDRERSSPLARLLYLPPFLTRYLPSSIYHPEYNPYLLLKNVRHVHAHDGIEHVSHGIEHMHQGGEHMHHEPEHVHHEPEHVHHGTEHVHHEPEHVLHGNEHIQHEDIRLHEDVEPPVEVIDAPVHVFDPEVDEVRRFDSFGRPIEEDEVVEEIPEPPLEEVFEHHDPVAEAFDDTVDPEQQIVEDVHHHVPHHDPIPEVHDHTGSEGVVEPVDEMLEVAPPVAEDLPVEDIPADDVPQHDDGVAATAADMSEDVATAGVDGIDDEPLAADIGVPHDNIHEVEAPVDPVMMVDDILEEVIDPGVPVELVLADDEAVEETANGAEEPAEPEPLGTAAANTEPAETGLVVVPEEETAEETEPIAEAEDAPSTDGDRPATDLPATEAEQHEVRTPSDDIVVELDANEVLEEGEVLDAELEPHVHDDEMVDDISDEEFLATHAAHMHSADDDDLLDDDLPDDSDEDAG